MIIRSTASNVELANDRRELHSVRRHMFMPTSQFHLYGHVTSRDRYGNSGEVGDDEEQDDDVDDDDEVDSEAGAPQLTVICGAARDVSFYLVNVYLTLVLIICCYS